MHEYSVPENEARVLVGVITRPRDLAIAREEGWYRVPLTRVPSHLAAEYLALYQTAAFGEERWAVRYYAPIWRYRLALRRELLPDEAEHPRANERYYRVEIGPLQQLDRPIPARRLRRVVFIATTFGQLQLARDVRDLFNPPEDRPAGEGLWGAGLAGKSIV
jgi:hypothetical protein